MGAYKSVIADTTIYEPINKPQKLTNCDAQANVKSYSAVKNINRDDVDGSSNGQTSNGMVNESSNGLLFKIHRNGTTDSTKNSDDYLLDETYEGDIQRYEKVSYSIVWHMLIYWTLSHTGAIYAIYLIFTSAKIYTFWFALLLGYGSGLGITAGT